MTFKKYLSAGLLMLFCSTDNYAQIKIPTFDIELKVHQNLIPGDSQEDGDLEFAETTNIYGGAHVQINQHIAIGGFYSRSFRGMGQFRYNDGNEQYDILSLQKGVDVRFSTGRAKNWRYYLSVCYFQMEMVQETTTFRLADKANAFGGSLGIMRRLSNNLYLNVIELGLKYKPDDIFWFNVTKINAIIDAKIGLTYNIGKKK